jgi:anthranilate phosphoribosyltransferase
MPSPSDPELQLAALGRGERMTAAEVCSLTEGVLAGTVDLEAFGRWLVALTEAGETAAEIAGVAAALRGRMLPLEAGLPAGMVVADTCGTGGDGSGSFNISTAAAIVVAAAGQPVAKHGNRAVSSRTGSADVLAALGVKTDAPVATAARCLRELGLCFCLAPAYHPAMAKVGPLRKSLGRPTVFNLVGPLCNPAGAAVQVIGVGRPAAREPIAEAARLLGASRTLVVSGFLADADGAIAPKPFDELSLFGPTEVIDVSPAGVARYRWTPEAFGLASLPPARLADLEVAGPEESAAAIRGVLAGEAGPRRDVVVLNAAAVLVAAGRGDPVTARGLAEQAIDSGRAADLLTRWAEQSHAGGGQRRP